MRNYLVILIVLISFLTSPLFAQNLIQGSNMENEDDWEIVYYNQNSEPVYEFNSAEGTVDVSPNRGGALRVTMEDGSTGGQLLIYQRVTCTAGETYKASALLKVLDFDAPDDPKGQWFQFYVTVDDPDPAASDFNPSGAKMFNISSWDGDMMSTFEDRNGYFEAVKMNSEIDTAPYWVCPGEAGTQVDVTVGVKFGSSTVDGAFFDLICDDISFYEVDSANEIMDGGMDDESAWNIVYYNAESLPEYEFVEAPEEAPDYLRGQVLHLTLDGSANGQLLLYQTFSAPAGATYRVSGAIHVAEYYSDFDPVGKGPWYQFYVSTELPDPAAGDFNPSGSKMFDISAWDDGCSMADFEQFQGYWEQVRCLSNYDTVPYFTVPGEEGTVTEMVIGIKFGHWAPDPGFFDIYVDDIQCLLESDGSGETLVDFKPETTTPANFQLEQNYPNPFNPTTTIAFTLPVEGHATLKVYNTLGELVKTLADHQMAAGRHETSLNVTDLSSGIYYYTLTMNDYTLTKKCAVLK